jgi:hypothetical protein
MSTPKPDKTIGDILGESVAAQEARLGSKTHAKYQGIVDLYRACFERCWPGHAGPEYDAVTQAGGTHCGIFGAEDITSGFSEFLDESMPHKVIAVSETMKSAGTVIKKLTRWLVEQSYTLDDESLRERVSKSVRDLHASQRLLDDLNDWLGEAEPVHSTKKLDGHFVFQRVEPEQTWLEPPLSGESEIGPIPVPAKLARSCKIGWDDGGVVASTAKRWRLVEV